MPDETVFVCAECAYPSRLPAQCDNPGCLSNPTANRAALLAQRAAYLARKSEEEERTAFRARLRRGGFTPAF